MMKGLTGSEAVNSNQDIYAAALRSDIDPPRPRTTPSRSSTTSADNSTPENSTASVRRHFPRCVWLRWPGRAWDGQNSSAAKLVRHAVSPVGVLLSQSGTVANRLGQVFEKQGQPEKARHMYA